MAERARVTSVEALESFRANLVLYLSKARPALEEAGQEVARLRQWLESDRRPYWDNEWRRRRRKLEEAEQALFSAKLSSLQEESSAQLQAVRRAKRAVEEAESKRSRVRQWTRDFENRTDPLRRQIGVLHGFLTTEMGQAVAHLGQVIQTLEAYADIAAPAPDISKSPTDAGESSIGSGPGESESGATAERREEET
jgi:hypothetical protein